MPPPPQPCQFLNFDLLTKWLPNYLENEINFSTFWGTLCLGVCIRVFLISRFSYVISGLGINHQLNKVILSLKDDQKSLKYPQNEQSLSKNVLKKQTKIILRYCESGYLVPINQVAFPNGPNWTSKFKTAGRSQCAAAFHCYA